TALADSLDTLTSGMFLVDATSHIAYANVSGQVLLREAKVLRATGGRLGAVDPAADQVLSDAFMTTPRGDAAVGGKGIAVPRQARGGARYIANVMPLTGGARRRAGASYAAVAVVFVHKAELDMPSPPEAVATAFQLTQAELRVLFAIGEIGGVPEVAPVLGIAEATVKAHLRSLYSKTGAKRQADLVKLIAGYTNPLLAQHNSDLPKTD